MRKDFLWTLALLLPLTLAFWVYPLDVAVQAWFFGPQACWCGAETPFWGFLYHYGIFIGYLWALAALVGIMLSYWFPARYLAWRKPALVMVFTVLVGPGILINAVLKDHWGRARPRDLEMFGGKESYTAPWAWGQTEGGKSFPCGHCSMGFYMAVPYLFLRRQRPGLAYVFLALGLSFGFLLGIARMMGGGHFLSDVLWSGGIVWLTALAGYALFRLDKPLVYKPLDKDLQKNRPAEAPWPLA
ncbi:MAG: phosphatase PAP2 family protein [Microscillaceae bacterium]|nr:phosphatase PAP2 family protein [Microscillaceae bacterium]